MADGPATSEVPIQSENSHVQYEKVRSGVGALFQNRFQIVKNSFLRRRDRNESVEADNDSVVIDSDVGTAVQEDLPTTEVSAESDAKKIRHLTDIVYRSFEFSQGSQPLQKDMFTYIHRKSSDLTMNESEKEKVLEQVQERILGRFFHGLAGAKGKMTDTTHYHNVSLRGVREEVKTHVNNMEATINNSLGEDENTEEVLIDKIAKGIIRRDYKYLVSVNKDGMRGRPRRGSYETDSKFDPFMSHLHYFAGEQHKIAVPEFAQMYEDIREYFVSKFENGEWKIDPEAVPTEEEMDEQYKPTDSERELSLMINRWQEKHPGENYLGAFGITPQPQARTS